MGIPNAACRLNAVLNFCDKLTKRSIGCDTRLRKIRKAITIAPTITVRSPSALKSPSPNLTRIPANIPETIGVGTSASSRPKPPLRPSSVTASPAIRYAPTAWAKE